MDIISHGSYMSVLLFSVLIGLAGLAWYFFGSKSNKKEEPKLSPLEQKKARIDELLAEGKRLGQAPGDNYDAMQKIQNQIFAIMSEED